MVPADRILDRAVEEGAQVIGLSGLITPSLDEMAHVAKEMQRRKLEVPLLIGGATTSKAHTALEIAPHYSQTVVHVLDASSAVGVLQKVIDPRLRADFDDENRQQQSELREVWGRRRRKPLVSLEAARANRRSIDWASYAPPKPDFLGLRTVEVDLEQLVPFIDWTFFFNAWELKGRFPRILDHPEMGEQARELYDNGRRMLDRILADGSIQARGAWGFWPAAAVGDDLVLFEANDPVREKLRFPMLRQQAEKQDDNLEHVSLADFVAPLDRDGSDGAPTDYLGAFAVTAGHGVDELVAHYEKDHDDYSAIMVKALADRLAEAFAERQHLEARRAWGYGRDENLSSEDLVAEKYRGIRPALGYPACPDHAEKTTLWTLLDAEARAGISLTEHFAMVPTAAVSGLYFSHPDSRYFAVGRIGKDQVEDYAARKGMTVAEAERWLAPNLGYEPD
jgi:5-methyltetrahydrofolate--homocysteine methyltransferase